MAKRRFARALCSVGLAAAIGGAGGALLNGAAPQDPPPRQGGGGMPDLPAGLRNSPGCLGVETGMMASGKQSIFAWFKDKESVSKWYYSEMHLGAMKALAPGLDPDHEPMEMVADDEGPILVIATLTMAQKPHFEAMPEMPISQISIELYKPLPGGAQLGGRLAPEKFKVKNMRDYTPTAEAGG